MKIALYIATILILITSCNQDPEYADLNYPTTIPDLSATQIDALYLQLMDANLSNCTYIDWQGRLIQNLNDEFCELDAAEPANYSIAEMLQLCKSKIASNYALFGVRDTSQLMLMKALSSDNLLYENYFKTDSTEAPTYWELIFNPQLIDKKTVLGTQIQCIISAEGCIAASGKWYPSIYVPTDRVSESEAQSSLYGVTLTYASSSYVPAENSTWFPAKKVIYPIYKSNNLEFHVCWALYPESWEIIIDTQNGQVLSEVNIDDL